MHLLSVHLRTPFKVTFLICFCLPEQLLLHPSWLLLVAGYLCEQLDAEIVDTALADQVVKNLLYVSSVLPSSESAFQATDPEALDRIEQAKEILGASRRGQKRGEDVEEPAEEDEEEGVPTDDHAASWALTLLFRRLEKISLRVQPTQVHFRCQPKLLSLSPLSPLKVDN